MIDSCYFCCLAVWHLFKGIVQQSVKSFQTCIICFFLLNTEKNISKKIAVFSSGTLTIIVGKFKMIIKGAPEFFALLNSWKHLILCTTEQKMYKNVFYCSSKWCPRTENCFSFTGFKIVLLFHWKIKCNNIHKLILKNW